MRLDSASLQLSFKFNHLSSQHKVNFGYTICNWSINRSIVLHRKLWFVILPIKLVINFFEQICSRGKFLLSFMFFCLCVCVQRDCHLDWVGWQVINSIFKFSVSSRPSRFFLPNAYTHTGSTDLRESGCNTCARMSSNSQIVKMTESRQFFWLRRETTVKADQEENEERLSSALQHLACHCMNTGEDPLLCVRIRDLDVWNVPIEHTHTHTHTHIRGLFSLGMRILVFFCFTRFCLQSRWRYDDPALLQRSGPAAAYIFSIANLADVVCVRVDRHFKVIVYRF